MKMILLFCLLFTCMKIAAQTKKNSLPTGNIRLSCLLFPPLSPLLTIEMRTFQNITVQLETNFINTHGINVKYFIKERMNGHYVFIGTAFLESAYLRKDKRISYLPYAGYGYAYCFGKSNAWTFDSRLGIGTTIHADRYIILPVLKTGIGYLF
jgi:hypothetical protein